MPHYEQDMPFEVPKGWVWTTLEEITSKIGSGSTPKGSNYSEEGIPFFRSQNVYNEGLVYEDIKFISDATHQLMIGTEVHSKDLLLNITGGSLGRCAIVPADFQIGNVSQHVCIIRSILVLSSYVHTFILSPFFKKTMNITGSGREGLPKYNLEKMFLPIPPLKEQERIIKEIEHWFTFIDTIEQSKVNLQTAIKQTKSKILDLAIHGKLVPQDPSDEPALELLKRINPKAQITCDNEHSRKLPYNWSCISHNSIIELSGGSQPPKRKFISKPTKGYIRLFQIRDYGKNPLPVYIPNVDAVKQTHKGDILLARYGGSLGKVFIAENGAYNVAMTKVIFKQPQLIDKMFAFFYYHSRVYQDKLKEISRTAQAGFNSGDFEDLYFPLPPLAEQKRIVRKIEDLFTLINIIEMELAE